MRKETHIKSYTAAELKGKHMVSRTDLKKVDAMTDAELEKAIAEDEDEQGLQPDWTRAKEDYRQRTVLQNKWSASKHSCAVRPSLLAWIFQSPTTLHTSVMIFLACPVFSR